MTQGSAAHLLLSQSCPKPLGQIIHIGAGRGADLPGYIALGPLSVTLVEPNADAVIALEQRAATQKALVPVHIANLAITAGPPDPHARLHRFNFDDLSSLRAPTGLLTVFPGLTEIAKEAVAQRSIGDFINELSLTNGKEHVLVIEAPGEAMALLNALAAAENLTQFACVIVQDGIIPLYDGATSLDDIEGFLVSRGYQGFERSTADPDRPHLCATRSRPAAEIQRLNTTLTALRADLESAQTQAREAHKSQDQAVRKLGMATQLQTALQTDLEALRAQHASLKADHAEQTATLETLIQSLQKAMAPEKVPAKPRKTAAPKT